MKKRKSGNSQPAKGGRRTPWWQKTLLACFGVVLILGLEGVLRLVGYGGVPPLSLEAVSRRGDDGAALSSVHRTNRVWAARFFGTRDETGTIRAGSMRSEVYAMPRQAGTLRVLYVGESTVEGFPMPRNLTSAAFLKEMLGSLAPDAQPEVLNLGITAVASWPIRETALRAMEELEPDVVVVYGAHNEFFGSGGVASAERLGTGPRSMAIRAAARSTATYQALEGVLRRSPAKGDGEENAGAQLIERMAGESFIPPGGDLHESSRKQLVANWRAIARGARKRGIPAIFCTVASNEQGMAPLVSSEEDLPEGKREGFRSRLTLAMESETRATVEGIATLRGLVAEAPRHALARYALAQALSASGDHGDEAAEEFRRARDLDALPWRAPNDRNEAIRLLVAEEPGAVLADVEAAFRERSGGATGWALFDDHVHPSLEGQALLARVIAEAMLREGLLPGAAADASIPPWTELAGRLGAHPLERFRVINMMSAIFEKPPMRLNNDAAYKHFRERLEGMIAQADDLERTLINNWNVANQEVGRSMPISPFALATTLRMQQPERAMAYRTGAVKNVEEFTGAEAAMRLLDTLSLAMNPTIPAEAVERVRVQSLAQARFTAIFPGEPTALTAYAIGCLELLGGDEAGFESALQILEGRSDSMTAEDEVYLRELPPPGQFRMLAEKLQERFVLP